MKRLWILMFVFLAACSAKVNYPDGHGGTGTDDSNTANSLSDVNPASIGSNYSTQIYNFLTKEDANRYSEQGFQNYVSTEANANACLGGTGAGLTMTPTSCIAYNAGFRGTETGSITFADNSTTWVAMDENTTGSNANLPNFSRVAGTHYLIDSVDVSPPTMASDSQFLMKVVTSGGAITAVTDLRNLTPLASGQNQGTNGLFNTITGTGTAPVIAGFNGARDNEINLMAYGASGAGVNVTTATGTSGQNTITVASATGWKKGQGIIVHHAGAAVTLSTPGAPTVTPKGTTGASTCTYAIRALTAKRGYTAASVTGSTASCNAVQNLSNYNVIKWSAVANAWGYAVERTTGTPALIAVTTDTSAVDIGQNAPYATFQSFAELPTTADGTTGADWLQTTISSINGTTLTLAANLTTSITSQQISHDDTTPITNAYTAAQAADKTIYVPQGTYFFCGSVLSGASINLQGTGSSAIITCDSQYPFQPSVVLSQPSKVDGMVFVGGLGAIKTTNPAAATNPNNSVRILHSRFYDFTGTGVAFSASDAPFWKFDHDFFQALDYNKTIGIAAPSSSGIQILNSDFQRQRIGVKCVTGCTGVAFANDTFIRAEPVPNPLKPRFGIWITPGGTFEAASGMTVTSTKFGNENISNVDAHAAVLDDDTTTGTDVSNYMPLYATADDGAISGSGTALTSAAECPFTSAMCQGGAGCTGASGNWPVIVEGAGPAFNNSILTTTITAFTNTCSVTVANAATTGVSGKTIRMAPTDSTNFAEGMVWTDNAVYSNGQPLTFEISSVVNDVSQRFVHNWMEINTVLELLPTLSNPAFNQGHLFIGNSNTTNFTNQDRWMTSGLTSNALILGSGNTNNGLLAGTVVGRFAAEGIGFFSEGGCTAGSTGIPAFGVGPNDSTTVYFDVDCDGLIKANGHAFVDSTGSISNACKSDVILVAGSGAFTNPCVTTASACQSKDITTPANVCTVAAPGSGSVAVTGTGTDHCRTWCE